jgi:hypothetical protein
MTKGLDAWDHAWMQAFSMHGSGGMKVWLEVLKNIIFIYIKGLTGLLEVFFCFGMGGAVESRH